MDNDNRGKNFEHSLSNLIGKNIQNRKLSCRFNYIFHKNFRFFNILFHYPFHFRCQGVVRMLMLANIDRKLAETFQILIWKAVRHKRFIPNMTSKCPFETSWMFKFFKVSWNRIKYFHTLRSDWFVSIVRARHSFLYLI